MKNLMGSDKNREIAHQLLSQASETQLEKINLIYCQLRIEQDSEKGKPNKRNLLPTLPFFPSSALFLTLLHFPPPWVNQMFMKHCYQIITLLASPHSFVPSWGPSHRMQPFMSYYNMNTYHRLQFLHFLRFLKYNRHTTSITDLAQIWPVVSTWKLDRADSVQHVDSPQYLLSDITPAAPHPTKTLQYKPIQLTVHYRFRISFCSAFFMLTHWYHKKRILIHRVINRARLQKKPRYFFIITLFQLLDCFWVGEILK